MTKRYYQLFALALLIGAPLFVSLLSNFIPGIHPLGPPAAVAAVRPDYMRPAVDPGANLPQAQPDPPPAQSTQQTIPGAGGSPPDSTGMSITGTDPSAAAASGSSAAPTMSAEPPVLGAGVGNNAPSFDSPQATNERANRPGQ